MARSRLAGGQRHQGIEASSAKRMTEVLADVLPGVDPDSIGVLAGPNLAREVIAGDPTATTVAFADAARAAAIQQRLTGPTFRVYTSTDVVGCEIGGAVKNVVAIAAGVAAGLGLRNEHHGRARHPRPSRAGPASAWRWATTL